MADKTLGQVAREAFLNATGPTSADDWECAVAAAILAHEARRWKPIAEWTVERPQCDVAVGRWHKGKWQQISGCQWPHVWAAEWTHFYIESTTLPAPPKEADHGA